MNIFHLAFPVHDLAAAREFYGGVLGCREGRSSDRWIDFDLYGHQIVTHLADGPPPRPNAVNKVDADHVPIPHFGIVLPMDEWRELANRLRERGVAFAIEPKVRFAGEVGEQATMFFHDPSGNALEFKGFEDLSRVFEK